MRATVRAFSTSLVSCCLLLTAGLAGAAPLRNVRVVVTQPDGEELRLYATGDEYLNWLHDKHGFTIVQDPETGYYVYADKVGDDLIATPFVVGASDPEVLPLAPGLLPRYRPPAGVMAADQGPNRAPKTGSFNNIVVFVRFSDETEFGETLTKYDAMFNATGAGAKSLLAYFMEVSYGGLSIKSTLLPPASGGYVSSYKDSHPRSYYKTYNAATNPLGYKDDVDRKERQDALVRAAVNAIAPLVPPSLNVDRDSDGLVDSVVVVVRGGPEGWGKLLWPKKSSLYFGTAYLNGAKVGVYNLQLQADVDVGVLAHEMFHTIGAPDLYHYDPEARKLEPAGRWDLMQEQMAPPQHMTTYMKLRYGGWVASIPEITTNGLYVLKPLTSPTGHAFRFSVPGVADQWFVVEYRRKTGLFEALVPDSGIIVYRIDDQLSGQGNAEGPPDELYVFRPGGSLTENGYPNMANLSKGAGRTSMTPTTDPHPFYQDGSPADFRIFDVGPAGDTISFRICIGPPNCTGKQCGDNGCGGSCGTCVSDETCVDGLCDDAGTCKVYLDCWSNCSDAACQNACKAAVSQAGLSTTTALSNCLSENGCFDVPDEEYYACLDDHCLDQYFRCYSGSDHPTCGDLWDCLDACPDDNPATVENEHWTCRSECFSGASVDANWDHQRLVDCYLAECPVCLLAEPTPAQVAECNDCYQDAISGTCEELFKRCGDAGTLTCLKVIDCLNACSDDACSNACWDSGTVIAQILGWDYLHCLQIACTDAPDWNTCATQAISGECFAEYAACANDGTVCTPDCDGKSCGDDGCGGSCGDCGETAWCSDQGTCVPCSCSGRECGGDGCGSPCGSCGAGEGCSPEGLCVGVEFPCLPRATSGCPDCVCEVCVCTMDPYCCSNAWDEICGRECYESCGGPSCPDLCFSRCEGKACGSDGCGGSCGECGPGAFCAADGSACINCNCDGRQCGDDGCGNSCGLCGAGTACLGGACVPEGCAPRGEPGCPGCACEACVCAADAYCCETEWDGICGAACGSDCGEACPCIPNCKDRECGDDGCGGSCGTCGTEDACLTGSCVRKGCGDLTFVGCCEGLTLHWCEDEVVHSIDCSGGQPGTCGWDSTLGYYDCEKVGADPTGQNPITCGCLPDCAGKTCGDDGCGGSCGECEDGDLCTGDFCNEGGTCAHALLKAGNPCDDGDPCTREDQCNGFGGCAGQNYVCPGPGPCQKSVVCDGLGGCTRVNREAGGPCDDGNPCTLSDRCDALGNCGGESYACPAASTCEQSVTCDGKGGCTTLNRPKNAPCDDAKPCTKGDVCDGVGTCHGQAYDCPAPTACQASLSCDGQGGCVAVNQKGGTPCDDGKACTKGDKCDGLGECIGDVYSCPAPQACQVSVKCDGLGGCAIVNRPEHEPCDDGDPCTSGDQCNKTGACKGQTFACPAPTPCEQSVSCDGQGGCTVVRRAPNSSCDDGFPCTKDDRCDALGSCVGQSYSCPVPGECQSLVTCDGQGGCAVVPLESGIPCTDDQLSCTEDKCDQGACTHPVAEGACLIEGTCVADGTQRAGTPCQACRASLTRRDWSPLGPDVACDDEEPCTSNDACDGLGGCSGSAYLCLPGPCDASASCDGKGGCSRVLKSEGSPCDDGDPCTQDDQCGGDGECTGAPGPGCQSEQAGEEADTLDDDDARKPDAPGEHPTAEDVPVAAEFPDEVPRDLPQLDVTLDEEVATVTDLDGSSPLEASGPSRKGSGGGCSARSAESPLGPAVPVAFLVVSLIGWSRVRRRENSR